VYAWLEALHPAKLLNHIKKTGLTTQKWNFLHVNHKNLNKAFSCIAKADLVQMVVKAAAAVDAINKIRHNT
jgi:hypothetical protein